MGTISHTDAAEKNQAYSQRFRLTTLASQSVELTVMFRQENKDSNVDDFLPNLDKKSILVS